MDCLKGPITIHLCYYATDSDLTGGDHFNIDVSIGQGAK
jgi:hypothetical protein